MSKEATKAAKERYPGSKWILPGQLNIAKSFQTAFENGWNAHESQQDKEMEEFNSWLHLNRARRSTNNKWFLGVSEREDHSFTSLLSLFRGRVK